MNVTMRRFAALLTLGLAMLACTHENLPETSSRAPDAVVSHDMIRLGEKLEDPYTVDNMRAALEKLYQSRAERIDIAATDLYVRFLPADEQQLRTLEEAGLYLLDHPMDYRIVQEGDYYQDPELGPDCITWQYATVPHDFDFPKGIIHEVLDECYISEHDPSTRAGSSIDWDAVEREAFRLSGNADMLEPLTRGESYTPEGRITIVDANYSGGKPYGLSGVKVACNIFVKISTCFTDRDGYYKMDKSFSGKPRYRIVFENSKGFCIGFNWVLVPASVCTLGTGSPEGIDYTVSPGSDANLFRRSVINNAAWEFYNRCTQADLDIAPPPEDLRIWVFAGLDSSSTVMLHHGAFLDNALLQKYLGDYMAIIKYFLPDITIGTKGRNSFADIWDAVMHELSHASHYVRAGNSYWGVFIRYIIESYITEGRQAYGSGTREDAGYCEVGESWAYFMESTLFKDRYGGVLPQFGQSWWFRPALLRYLYERGMTRGEIYRSLKSGTTSMEAMKKELISLYPNRETLIRQCFEYYGK